MCRRGSYLCEDITRGKRLPDVRLAREDGRGACDKTEMLWGKIESTEECGNKEEEEEAGRTPPARIFVGATLARLQPKLAVQPKQGRPEAHKQAVPADRGLHRGKANARTRCLGAPA